MGQWKHPSHQTWPVQANLASDFIQIYGRMYKIHNQNTSKYLPTARNPQSELHQVGVNQLDPNKPIVIYGHKAGKEVTQKSATSEEEIREILTPP